MNALTLLLLLAAVALASCASPQDGRSDWTGGGYHEKISDYEYVVTAQIAPGYGPARLRAVLLQHSRELAAKHGFSGFAVKDPMVGARQSLTASAYVRLLNIAPAQLPAGFEYFRTKTDQDSASTNKEDHVKLVSGGTTSNTSASIGVGPLYFDAIDQERGWSSDSYLLRPGPQLVVLGVSHRASLLGSSRQYSVPLRLSLIAGQTYAWRGSLADGAITVWIEDVKTGVRVASHTFRPDA